MYNILMNTFNKLKIGFFAKEYAKKEYDEFTTAYKNLGDKIRPGIYDFGFLQR